MGKRIRVQRLGRGSPTFRVASHRRKVEKVSYPPYSPEAKTDAVKGQVVAIFHDVGRRSPIMEVWFEDETYAFLPAPEGIAVGDWIKMGPNAGLAVGNIMPLHAIPEGTPIYNIEGVPGDGGKYVRSSGGYAVITTKTDKRVYVKLPSGKIKEFHPDCRATIGNVSGGGRTEKPFVKAGKRYHVMKALGKKSVKVRGVAMNVVDHPHGGKEHHPPGPTTVSRNAPPGRKVGHIAARRTGRRKK